MSTFLTFVLAISVISGFNPFVGLMKSSRRAYLFGYLLRVGIIGLFLSSIYYFYNPALVGPFWGTTVWVLSGLGINVLISVFELMAAISPTTSNSDENVSKLGFNYTLLLLPMAFVAIVLVRLFMAHGFFTADECYAMAGDVIEGDTETLKPLSLEHIRIVAREQATWKGEKVIADSGASLGSKFHPGLYNAQRVKDKLYWISFLQYNAFNHWQAGEGGTPGFVMVSAEEIDKRGELITEIDGTPLKLQYVESAFLWDNLERYIYLKGYQNYQILDIHREVNDELRPYSVVTLGSPTQQYHVPQIDLVLLVDPQTGEIKEHTLDDLPEWVDRVFPAELVQSYLEWWGMYHDHWLNSWWGKNEVVKPTESNGRSLRLVWGADGQCYWFTGVTSVATSDQALVKFVLVNSRSGEITEYKTSGIDESAALDAVNSSVSNFGNWHGSDCILYHLYGEWAYVVPVLDDKGIFQRLAIVRLENGKVALGKTQQEAMREFQLLQVASGKFTPGEGSSIEQVTVEITRISGDVQDGRTVYYLETDQLPGKVLTGTSQLSPFLPTIQPGDRVRLGVMETGATELPLQSFEPIHSAEKE